jgi:hypothetical protein
MLLEVGLEALEDLHRVLDRGLVHVDLLEAPRQGAVLLEVLAELLVGGGAHAAELAALEGGLEEVGRVHRAARGGAGADHGVDLVDEEHGVGMASSSLTDDFQPLLEVAAVAGAGQSAPMSRLKMVAPARTSGTSPARSSRRALGDGGLAHAGVAH